MDWLLTPIRFAPITHFNPVIHKVDQEAKLYLQRTSLDVQNTISIDVIANGNCLYNSIICLTGDTVLTSCELRSKYFQLYYPVILIQSL